jgi:hypothetical protein
VAFNAGSNRVIINAEPIGLERFAMPVFFIANPVAKAEDFHMDFNQIISQL